MNKKTILNGLLTLITAYIGFRLAWFVWDWGIINATWTGSRREACLVNKGACWPMIADRLPLLLYGYYPTDQVWRIHTAFGVFGVAVAKIVSDFYIYKAIKLSWLWKAFYASALGVCGWLLYGGFGLPLVETSAWGGLMLTIALSVVSCLGASVLSVFLALGRTQTTMPLLRWLCTGWIEFFRGVPFITVLFMASVMLPLFLPPDVTVNKLLRVMIGLILFQSAYLAEVLRGGLQAIPRGQLEAASALGMGYWKTQRHIILPQAVSHVIPGITGITIGILKETTLVLIVGMSDFLSAVELMIRDVNWTTPQSTATGYVFAGLVYFALCYSISTFSHSIEKVVTKKGR